MSKKVKNMTDNVQYKIGDYVKLSNKYQNSLDRIYGLFVDKKTNELLYMLEYNGHVPASDISCRVKVVEIYED